jgi:hypothetical protein
MPDLLDELVDRAEGEDLLAAANEHFAEHGADHRSEVEAWEGVAADGLGRE